MKLLAKEDVATGTIVDKDDEGLGLKVLRGAMMACTQPNACIDGIQICCAMLTKLAEIFHSAFEMRCLL